MSDEFDPFKEGKKDDKAKAKKPKKERRQDVVTINFTHNDNRIHAEKAIESLDALHNGRTSIKMAGAGRVAFAVLDYCLEHGDKKIQAKIAEFTKEYK